MKLQPLFLKNFSDFLRVFRGLISRVFFARYFSVYRIFENLFFFLRNFLKFFGIWDILAFAFFLKACPASLLRNPLIGFLTDETSTGSFVLFSWSLCRQKDFAFCGKRLGAPPQDPASFLEENLTKDFFCRRYRWLALFLKKIPAAFTLSGSISIYQPARTT